MMVVTRFAPSPTGFLHIGGLRSALYPFLMAKHEGGRFILRYEDTDRKRLVVEGYDMIKKGLEVFGIVPDEVFMQSERLDLYKKYAAKLVESRAAYYCFATTEEVDKMRKEAADQHMPFRFRSPYRDLPLAEAQKRIASGEPYAIRQKLPENRVIEFVDELQGKVRFNTDDTDEGVLLKSDGYPTYHLGSVVDDIEMKITHVFRGVEWLPSAPKHVLLYEALKSPMPKFYHLSLILDPEGGKLSKRKGAVAVHDFIKQGYMPEAVLNFVALLGWTPAIERNFGEAERELFLLKDMIELFSADDLNKPSPIFNREKLLWFNQKYIQALQIDELQNRFTTWLKETVYDDPELISAITSKGPDYLNKILALEGSRIRLLSEIPDAIRFYYIHKGGIDFLKVKQTKNLTALEVKQIIKEYKALVNLDVAHEEWEKTVRDLAGKLNVKAGSLFMVLRLALTDTSFSPPLFDVMKILGQSEVIARLESYS